MQKGSPVLVVVLILIIVIALFVVYKYTIGKSRKGAAPGGKFEGMTLEQYRQKMMQPAPPPGRGGGMGPAGGGGPAPAPSESGGE